MATALQAIAVFLSGGRAGAASIDWSAVGYGEAVAVRAWLVGKGRAPATVNRYLSALRGVLRRAWLAGELSADQYQRAAAVRGVACDQAAGGGRQLTAGEVRALFEAAAELAELAAARDGAALGLLYGCGLRRAEAAALTRGDVGAGWVRVFRGKGGRSRRVPMPAGTAAAVGELVELAPGDQGDPLLVSLRGSGGVTAGGLARRLRWLCRRAGVEPCGCHDLRRSFVGHLLDSGADLSMAARLAGHSQVQTAARYDRRGDDAAERAAGRLLVPYRSRPMTVMPSP
jgi:integrase